MIRRVPPVSSGSVVSVVRPLALLGFLATLSAGGCSSSSGSGSGNAISGKVTLNGQAVAGTLAFTGPDNKEVSAPINADGTYQVTLPGKGDYTILVKPLAAGMNKGGAPVPPPKDAPAPKDMPDIKGSPGVPPPARYAQPNNGLKLTVTGGPQTHDIELK